MLYNGTKYEIIEQGRGIMASPIINSIDRALDIIDYMYFNEGEVSVTQISKDLNIYKSTVHRTLATLEAKNYVTQNTETGKYTLGMRLYLIGAKVEESSILKKFIAPYAKLLYEEFNEAVNVSILEQVYNELPYTTIIYKEESDKLLSFTPPLGARNEIYTSASGKCIIAFSKTFDFSIFEKFPMQKYTEKSITTVADLKQELAKVQRQGYAIDDEEREPGMTCVAAPIFRGDKIMAAISVSGPVIRMKDDFDLKIKRVVEIANKISEELK